MDERQSDYWSEGGDGPPDENLIEDEDGDGGDLDKPAVIEALLLVSPEPVSATMVSEITGFEVGAVREIMNRLIEQYRERDGGIVIREVGGGYSFYARPEASRYVSRLIQTQVNPRLTRAALETISIVAYLQPVSRGVVAEIRGVQSDSVMRTLEERGLVRQVGKGGPPGYPALYSTTTRFLERFGLNSVEELPSLEDFAPDEETVERINRSLSWEMLEEESGDGGSGAEGTKDTFPGGDSFPEGGGGPDKAGEGDL